MSEHDATVSEQVRQLELDSIYLKEVAEPAIELFQQRVKDLTAELEQLRAQVAAGQLVPAPAAVTLTEEIADILMEALDDSLEFTSSMLDANFSPALKAEWYQKLDKVRAWLAQQKGGDDAI